MTTHAELAEELNLVASYAELPFWIEVKPAEEEGQSLVKVFRCHNEEKGKLFVDTVVDTNWANGNARKLSDHTDEDKFLEALSLSDPEIKEVPDRSPSH